MLKLKLKKIAITGAIASGKSTVCKYFKKLGFYVVDTDSIIHQLLSSKTSIGQRVIKLLGEDILTNGEISREKIAKIVFEDQKKLLKLEKLLHPLVFKEIKKIYKEVKKKNIYNFFVVEMPLLFEAHQEKFYDYIITVVSDKKICPKKFFKDIEKREKRLMPIKEKMKKADFIIFNSSSFTYLKNQIKKIANILTNL